ncbi:hypothetical protein PIB30_070452 [Stylosanthes scabra]|uniref:BLOC-1-related complex subunit 7 n=1 Tax=Stylosanthes scabra TaxID=79078 RepID=A0ABU6QPJ4_9FABA|nr:hypothetical protein [Stylosanthes scabra]
MANSNSNFNTESDSSGSVIVTSQTSAQQSEQNSPNENIRQNSGNNGNGSGNGNQIVNLGEVTVAHVLGLCNRHLTQGRSVEASSSNSGVSIQTVRQLIDESHLDLVNLLSQHMTTILNPIVSDTNAKYDHLAQQVERVTQLVNIDDDTGNRIENENENNDIGPIRIVPIGQNVD